MIHGGRIIDGTGNPWYVGDIAITDGRIVAMGKIPGGIAKRVIEANGMVVAPGFIDMLGQSETALLIDNRSISKLAQGITSEITGEGGSIAPQNALTIAAAQPSLDPYHLKIDWTTLDDYWQRLAKKGTPINIGTYVGAAQVREAVLGDVNRAPTPEELEKMKALVAQAMQQGALGISTALIYPPGHYAKTEELIELAKVAARYGGIYATHMRSEGQNEVAAVREALRIGEEAHIPVEIFHLKVSGKSRAGKMVDIVRMIQQARDRGQDVTADMYPYLGGRHRARFKPAAVGGRWRHGQTPGTPSRSGSAPADQDRDVGDGRAHLGESLSRCRRSAGRDGCVGGESGAEAIYRQDRGGDRAGAESRGRQVRAT